MGTDIRRKTSVPFWKKKPVAPPQPPHDPSGPDRRETARFETSVISCDLGDVLDLSRKGARIRVFGQCRTHVGQELTFELRAPTEIFGVRAKVARVDRVDQGRFELGLEFSELPNEEGETLDRLARTGIGRATTPTADRAEQLRKLAQTLKGPDYYSILGVSPRASTDDLQKAFRKLARQYHPDLNKAPDAERKFCEINKAHEVLCDPARRAEYDALSGFAAAA